jgi:hypothetical protein
VRATAYGDRQVVVAGEAHGRHHVAGVRRPHDHSGSPVDHRVVDASRLVVGLVVGRDDLAPDALAQLLDPSTIHGKPLL